VALATRRLGNFAFYAYRASIYLSISRAPFDHLPFVTTSCVLCERIHVNRRTWRSLSLFARVDGGAASVAVFLIFHGAPRHRRKNWRFDPLSFSDSVIPRQAMTCMTEHKSEHHCEHRPRVNHALVSSFGNCIFNVIGRKSKQRDSVARILTSAEY
jgi:hypothetical protein